MYHSYPDEGNFAYILNRIKNATLDLSKISLLISNLERVGQGPSVFAVGAGGGCLDIFSLVYYFSFFLPLSGRRPDID